MNILLVSSNSGAAGGGEKYLCYLARVLREAGQQVSILLSNNEDMDVIAFDCASAGVNIFRDKFLSLRDRPFRFIQSAADKRQISKIKKY